MTTRSSFLAHFLPVGYVEPANNEKRFRRQNSGEKRFAFPLFTL